MRSLRPPCLRVSGIFLDHCGSSFTSFFLLRFRLFNNGGKEKKMFPTESTWDSIGSVFITTFLFFLLLSLLLWNGCAGTTVEELSFCAPYFCGSSCSLWLSYCLANVSSVTIVLCFVPSCTARRFFFSALLWFLYLRSLVLEGTCWGGPCVPSFLLLSLSTWFTRDRIFKTY